MKSLNQKGVPARSGVAYGREQTNRVVPVDNSFLNKK
jgi:hypothetical protein